MTSRAQRLLEAPILPMLARLAAPGVVLVVFQSAASIADTHFVGRLGTEPLAGLALVFPLVMLLQMTSAGAMGGGVTSAVARALGAGNEHRARALVVHAIVIAGCMGLAFSAVLFALGPGIYRLLGGKSQVLEQALRYSNVLFAGAVLVWFANTLASLLRGAGNTMVPAIALIAGALVQIPLSGMLVLGVAPLPRLGIAGAGIAYVIGFGLAACAMVAYVWRSALRPARADLRLEPRLFRDILSVGAISSLNALQTVLTAVVLTGFVGSFGAAALAGYGVGVRLELLQIPLVFAIGQAMVALVGTNIGAGRIERAKRIAWTGTAFAACLGGAIGIAVALVPSAWVGLFSSDPDVLAAGMRYLRIVGPCYAFLAVGVALYFASQGAARMIWPVLAGTVRLVIAVVAGALAVAFAGPLAAIFAVVAAAMVAYGTLTALAVARSSWRR
jgi:putative MATE family efflux protein